ncbi:hypothetical protein PINS_up007496 [Pythium insidiosum]|nr:hypothetical protein PINS_up007496 [Pythium insidiosum]
MASMRPPSSSSSASSAAPALDATPRSGDGDDNDDEKVYYGFGVFMGLPLADLRAMKDEFQQKQAMALGSALHVNGGGNGNGSGNGGALGAHPPHSIGHGHGLSHPTHGPSHGHSLAHGHGHGHSHSHRGDDGVVPPVLPNGGVDVRRAPLRGAYGDYELRDPMGRPHPGSRLPSRYDGNLAAPIRWHGPRRAPERR